MDILLKNFRIWSDANLQAFVEMPLYAKKVIVWCALWAQGIIGPYFFEIGAAHNVTLNGERSRHMINYLNELKDVDEDNSLSSDKTGTTSHITNETGNLFGQQITSRRGPVV